MSTSPFPTTPSPTSFHTPPPTSQKRTQCDTHTPERLPAQWMGTPELVTLTQAFSHRGAPLIRTENTAFAGHPGLALHVRSCGNIFEVTFSPICGHHASVGGENIPHGAQCELLCPQTGEPLPLFGDPCPDGSAMQSIQLTATYQAAHIGAIGNRWGSPACRVFDSAELLEILVLQEAT